MFTIRPFIQGLILLLAVLLSGSSFALTISGAVLDLSDETALSGANVLLHDTGATSDFTSTGTISDKDGNFAFLSLNPGEYILSASYIGYGIVKLKISLENEDAEVVLKLKPEILSGQDVVLTASRAEEGKTPATFSNLTAERINQDYWAQDIPLLLESIPGMNSFAESGIGIGYTHVRIRGFDERRLGVTINNLPLNDPEEGEVYWVDMPDLVSSLEDIQVQRGVGYSTFGTGAFGGSINLQTIIPSQDKPTIESNFGVGSFNTRKWGVALNSGLVNNTYGFYGRFSRIQTDGYRYRSGVELNSYFLSGIIHGRKNRLRLNVYGGREITNAAWYASAEEDIKKDRRHNPLTYSNTVDDFTQPHYELHHEWEIKPGMMFENGLFWVRGEGYYEQFKEDADLVEFGMGPALIYDEDLGPVLIDETDLVNQKWVKKDHIGWVPRFSVDHLNGTLKLGADIQTYWSDHNGYVIWAANLPTDTPPPRNEYYRHKINITQGGLFVQEIYQPTLNWTLVGDLELRGRYFELEQEEAGNFTGADLNKYDETYLFLNPKIGANYKMTPEINIFGNVGLSHRAPNDNEYWDVWQGADDLGVDPLFTTPDTIRSNGEVIGVEWSDPIIEPEQLLDFEFGFSYLKEYFRFKMNWYWMDFHNEIIPYGGVNDGSPVTDNADRSVHKGIELETSYMPKTGLAAWMNLSYSLNELTDYTTYGYDENWQTIEINLSGNQIALFPDIIAHGSVGYKTANAALWLDTRYVGKQYLDNLEDEEKTIDPYNIFGMSASYTLPESLPLANWELKLRVNNLTDVEFETSGYYDAWAGANYYFVGAERNYFLTLTARY